MESFYDDHEMIDADEEDEHQQQQHDLTTKTNKSLVVKQNLMQQNEEFSQINYSDQIHIYLKMKPLSKEEELNSVYKSCYLVHSNTGISVNPPKTSVYARNLAQMKQIARKLYKFSYVFQSDINQQDFFNATLYPCFDKVFEKSNLLVFSYGITNSGKTYTMQGNTKHPGIIPRSIDLIFNALHDQMDFKRGYLYKPFRFNEIQTLNDSELAADVAYKDSILNSAFLKKEFDDCEMSIIDGGTGGGCLYKTFSASTESLSAICNNFDIKDDDGFKFNAHLEPGTKYAIWISFYELYNDCVYDLLIASKKSFDQRVALKIREDGNRIPYVEGLVNVPVFSTYEAIKVLKFGEKNLQKSSNSINTSSSRSHAIFCLKIVSAKANGVFVNQVTFCDLAGMERSSKTNAEGKTFKEATTINGSLLALSRCLNVLIESQKSKASAVQVPYRTNKLTRLFQAYFEGGGMIKMITNINPSSSCFDETVNVLNFASIANKIQLDENDMMPAIKLEPQEITVGWDMNATQAPNETTQYDEEDEDEEDQEKDETRADDDDETVEVEDDGEDHEEESESEYETDDEENDEKENDEDETTVNSTTQKKSNNQGVCKSKRRSSRMSLGVEDLKHKTTAELIDIIKAIKEEKRQQKITFKAYEYQLRDEIVTKWSKIVNDEIKYYEEELVKQREKLNKSHREALLAFDQEAKQELDEVTAEMEQSFKEKLEFYEKEITKLQSQQQLPKKEKLLESKSIQCELTEEKNDLLDDLKEDLEMREKQIKELMETNKLLASAKESLKSELTKSNEIHSEMNTKIKELNDEITLSRETLEEIESENEKLERANKESQEKIGRLRETIKDAQILESKYKDLKLAYRETEGKYSELKELYAKLKEENQSLQDTLNELENQIASLENENDKFKHEMDSLTKAKSNVEKELNARFTSLKVELEDVKCDLNLAEVRCQSIAEENSILKVQLAELKEVASSTHNDHSIASTKTKSKLSSASSRTNKVVKQSSKSSVNRTDDIAEEGVDSVSRKTSSSSSVPVSNSVHTQLREIQNVPSTKVDDSIVIDEESATAKPIKKGIRNRLTDMISKSPILEPMLRARRPSRVASTKSTLTTKSSKTTNSVSVDEDDEISHTAPEMSSKATKVKTMIKPKKSVASSLLADKMNNLNLDDDYNNENVEDLPSVSANTPVKAPKKTRSKKKV